MIIGKCKQFSWLAAFGLALGVAALPACGDKADKDEKSSADAKKDDKDDKGGKGDKSAKPGGSAAAAPGSAAPTGGKPAPTPVTASGASASAHLPAGCELAMELDLGKLWANPAVAKDIVPKLEAYLTTPASKPEPKKFQEMFKELGLGPKSLKSVALCVKFAGAEKPFSLFLGGDLKPNSIVPAFKKLVESEGKKDQDFQEVDGVTVVKLSDDFFGQYADGVLGIGDTLELWKAGATTGANAAGYKLGGHELGLYLSQAVIEKELMKGKKGDDLFKEMKEVTGFLDLDTKTVNLRIACKDAEGAKKLDSMITLAKGELMKDKSKTAMFGLDKALETLTQKLDGTDLVFEAKIPDETIAQAIGALSAQLDKGKSQL